jgi:hypothetical protein
LVIFTEGEEEVFKHYIVASALAILGSSAVIAAQAQSTPQAPQPQTQTQTESRATSQQPSTVLTGCVYREQDVPGRAPNVAERAGILEDYILAEVAPNQQQSAAASSGTPGATGTSGTAPAAAGSMYKLELVEDDRLRSMVGKRVEVAGRIDAELGDSTGRTETTPQASKTDRVIGRDRIDLPEFEVVSIREVAGTCPAKPSSR